jgi:hypothetical protein
MIDTLLQQELKDYLMPNERLLWAGKPVQGLRLQKSDWFMVPFSLIWCCFSIFWIFGASLGGGYFGLFGIPFVLVGLYLVFGRFFYDSFLRKSAIYGVSNQRILIKEGVLSNELLSLDLKNLPALHLIQFDNGGGTITFGEDITTGYGKRAQTQQAPKFDAIEEVSSVYQLILSQKGDVK